MRNLGDSVLPSSLALLVVNLCVVGRSPWCQNGTIPHNIGWTTWKKRPKIKFYKEYFQTDSKFRTYSGFFQIQEIPSLRTKLAYMRLEDSWSMAHIHLKNHEKMKQNEARLSTNFRKHTTTWCVFPSWQFPSHNTACIWHQVFVQCTACPSTHFSNFDDIHKLEFWDEHDYTKNFKILQVFPRPQT